MFVWNATGKEIKPAVVMERSSVKTGAYARILAHRFKCKDTLQIM